MVYREKNKCDKEHKATGCPFAGAAYCRCTKQNTAGVAPKMASSLPLYQSNNKKSRARFSSSRRSKYSGAKTSRQGCSRGSFFWGVVISPLVLGALIAGIFIGVELSQVSTGEGMGWCCCCRRSYRCFSGGVGGVGGVVFVGVRVVEILLRIFGDDGYNCCCKLPVLKL